MLEISTIFIIVSYLNFKISEVSVSRSDILAMAVLPI